MATERWTRRDFLALSGATALAALVPPQTLLAATTPSSAPQAGAVPANVESLYRNAFVLWRGLGTSYEGGVLDNSVRIAIHLIHRMGALAITVALSLVAFVVLC